MCECKCVFVGAFIKRKEKISGVLCVCMYVCECMCRFLCVYTLMCV